MGVMDNMKDKAQDAMGKHGDKIEEGMDKAGNAAKEKTGGKHDDKIDQGVERGKQEIDEMNR